MALIEAMNFVIYCSNLFLKIPVDVITANAAPYQPEADLQPATRDSVHLKELTSPPMPAAPMVLASPVMLDLPA